MRIRKHAKISQLLNTTSSSPHSGGAALLQTYICQLNQSPWDVMDFSPPSSPSPPPPPLPPTKIMTQVDAGDTCGRGDVGFSRRVSVEEREVKNGNGNNGVIVHAVVSDDDDNDDDDDDDDDKREQCCKTDGKSWRCRREAAPGNSLCSHHLSLVKSYQNLGQNGSKKCKRVVGGGVETRHSSRTNKKKKKMKGASVVSSNPHEFYYYSGFRPGWSKNRDHHASRVNGTKKVEEAKIIINEELIGSEEGEYEDEDDDEEYDDDEISGGLRKKRNRKPVKARSLKSLM